MWPPDHLSKAGLGSIMRGHDLFIFKLGDILNFLESPENNMTAVDLSLHPSPLPPSPELTTILKLVYKIP